MTEQPADPKASLERLVGTWELEAIVDGQAMLHGSTTFEWIQEGAFVLQRADAEVTPEAPSVWTDNSPMPTTAVIGADDTTGECSMLYSDARGVFRIYRMRFDADSWTVWRDAPGFFQRFIGSFADEGRTINGRWESSPDGSAWEPDFEMRYRR
jgi:hypothetical protein